MPSKLLFLTETSLMLIPRFLRISSWLKNVFVLAPVVFSLQLFDVSILKNSILACLVFCLTSSGLYVINDIVDRDEDRLHPRKKTRPIAAGQIKIPTAIVAVFVLFTLGALGASFLDRDFQIVLLIFIINNLLYSYYWKKVNLIDSFSVAASFVFRTIAGCAAISVTPSPWIIVMTFTIALFLIFIKRKSELLMLGKDAVLHRKALAGYSVNTLNQFILITASITIAAYILYSTNKEVCTLLGTAYLHYSSAFVFLGIFRFIQLSDSDQFDKEGDPTTLIVKDRFSQFNLLAYILFIIGIIYL